MRGRLTRLLLVVVALCAASVAWSLFQREVAGPLPHLKVEVLNGSGIDRLGAGWAERLRALGQDVVVVGDADRSDYSRTVLIDRRGRPRLSERLARELGGMPLILQAQEGAEADLTLLLGADHGRYPGPP